MVCLVVSFIRTQVTFIYLLLSLGHIAISHQRISLSSLQVQSIFISILILSHNLSLLIFDRLCQLLCSGMCCVINVALLRVLLVLTVLLLLNLAQ